MYTLELEAISEIIGAGGYTNIVVDKMLKSANFTDSRKRLFTRIVYGVIENKIFIDYQLKFYLKLEDTKAPFKNLLRMGVYMIFMMDIKNHHVVNELVEMAKKRDYRSSKMVNAVLREMLRQGLKEIPLDDKCEYFSIKYSYPLNLVKLLNKMYPEELESILKPSLFSYNSYRINNHLMSNDEVKRILNENNIEYTLKDSCLKTQANLLNHELFKTGVIVFQDYASQKVALTMNPRPNEKILDVCSAPGMKACHLGSLMADTGEVVACDIHKHKLTLIEENIKKQHLHNVKVDLKDGTIDENSESYDQVLIDAPCSGLGVMKHKVDLKYHVTMNKLKELVTLQQKLLFTNARKVKIGGYLTYSTCTINKAENEAQIARFLAEYSTFKIVTEESTLPINDEQDGFYICKMIRLS